MMVSKKKILILEDEVELSDLIKLSLEKENFEPRVFRGMAEARVFLEEEGAADLIWLDHRLLGKQNGLDFVRWLYGDNKNLKNIPVFVVATIMTENEIREYLRLGVKKYYLKSENRLGKIIDDVKDYLK